jgi:hypothetical protein
MSAGISARKSLCFMCPERPQRILCTPIARVRKEQHGCRNPRNDTFLLRLPPHAWVKSLAPRVRSLVVHFTINGGVSPSASCELRAVS